MSRIIASAAILLSIGMIPPTKQARTPSQTQDEAQARIEVRLRKLHLVRPDLIPYPIHFDVYC